MMRPGLRLLAASIGSSAALFLDGVQVGSVQSVFSRAINVLVADRMVCLVRSDVGRGPMNVVLDVGEGLSLTSVGVQPGMRIRKQGTRLVLGEGVVTVELPPVAAGAPSRRPRPLRDVSRAAGNLERLRKDILLRGNLAGFGNLLSEPAAGLDVGSPQVTPAAKAASRPLREMVRALSRSDLDPVPEAARSLIGLGPGLTPAADDVLVGLMIALLLASKALGREDDFAERANACISSEVGGRTTRLSMEFLLHAARGLGGERTVCLLEQVLFGRAEDVDSAALRLFEVGATSGTDTAFGVLLGVAASLEAKRRAWT